MIEAANVFRRWARLKQEAKAIRPPKAVLTGVGTAEVPNIDATKERPVDPASLPSIESIAADTDIVAFLQSNVPIELTRAALRRAWAKDPAIRDFIGLAENQWDFNDPDGIPGFGPLSGAESGTINLTPPEMPSPLAHDPLSVTRSSQCASDERERPEGGRALCRYWHFIQRYTSDLG